MYLRMKDPSTLSISTNLTSSNNSIKKFILSNEKSLYKEYLRKTKESKSYFLGEEIEIDDNYEDKLREAITFYTPIVLDKIKKYYTKEIPEFDIKYRKMKSRWGVCNVNKKVITLNIYLMRYSLDALEYTLVHEISHFYHHNHGKGFWNLVKENYPDYKKVIKELKND